MFRRHLIFTTLPLFFPGLASAQTPGTLPRLLVYNETAGFVHDVSKRPAEGELSLVEQALVALGKQNGAFEAVVSRDPRSFEGESLARFRAVFFHTTGELPLSDAQKRSLIEFVRGGGGFVGSHCAADTFYEWPEYGELLGAYLDEHPWNEKVKVRVEDEEHPATRHLGGSFEIEDEIYQFKAPYARERLHVLLSLDNDANDLARASVKRRDLDFAVAWCQAFGEGRSFYTSLGHRPEVWADARFREHLLGGIRWAMGELEGSAEPSEEARAPTTARLVLPEGFESDLIAEAPEILWPSAVHALSDGSLLVAEDPMDMPGRTDQPLDRILRFVFDPDGTHTTTVFARDLYATFGLQEVDGAVLVMNMPHLTRLCDADGDGVAEEREELITNLGPPAPGFPGGFNDHIVSGIRLGMDGFLYVSVGDKGIPHATGTDGASITLRGGGVVRLRPDGTHLEVVASGTRNHLDVAIDERGEMFTYDNTDDGLGWWTRVTHIIQGGYYGYPWDYQEHPERMLPCMADYGGGSPCGGLAYREAAWPAPYAGSLFWCEWGKGVVRRIEVAPSGSSFRVVKDEDFARAGDVAKFRPLDLCESPDGRFLYLADWGWDGWRVRERTGRLWRIRRANDDPKLASRAPELPADAPGLVARLDAPGFNERLAAQRALEKLGTPAKPALLDALESSSSERVRRHAIWALEAMETRDALDGLVKALRHADADTRAQAARALGTVSRLGGKQLVELLFQPEPRVRREAATALGRLRERPSVKQLVRCLTTNDDLFAGWAVRDALRRIGVWDNQVPAAIRWMDVQQNPLLLALRDCYDLAAVERLIAFLEIDPRASTFPMASNPELRVRGLETLASMHRKPEPWDGVWWNIQPAKQPPPPKTLEWEGTAKVLAAVRSLLADRETVVRLAALEAVRTMPDREALPLVRERWIREGNDEVRLAILDVLAALRDEVSSELLRAVVQNATITSAVRSRAIETASAIGTPGMVELLVAASADRSLEPSTLVSCARGLGRLRQSATAEAVLALLRHEDASVRAAACDALALVQGAEAAPALERGLRDGSIEVRKAAVHALGELELASAVPALLATSRDPELRLASIEALARRPDARALDAFLLGLVERNLALRDASRRALRELRDEIRPELEGRAAAGELDPLALSELRALYGDPQPLLEWRLCGPFPRAAAPRIESEPLDFARTYASGGEQLSWIEHRAEAEHGFVDLERALASRSNVAAYAACSVASASEREAEMAAGSDDSLTVWVNGSKVHDSPGDRAWSADEDRFRVRLREGENSILLKIGQGGDQWSFNAKLAGDGAGPLFEVPLPPLPTLEDYRAHSAEHAGDPARGRELFRDAAVLCTRCHQVGEGPSDTVGEHVGPDLSDVGARYDREELVRSVLEPSQRIADGYKAEKIVLEDGNVLFGQVQGEAAGELVVVDTNGEARSVALREIVERGPSPLSLMPEGLATLISPEEFADLVAYLESLKQVPAGSGGGH